MLQRQYCRYYYCHDYDHELAGNAVVVAVGLVVEDMENLRYPDVSLKL